MLRDGVQEVVKVPADARQRLVEGADVHTDAELVLAVRGMAPCAAYTIGDRMA
jgi:hypothetical protein